MTAVTLGVLFCILNGCRHKREPECWQTIFCAPLLSLKANKSQSVWTEFIKLSCSAEGPLFFQVWFSQQAAQVWAPLAVTTWTCPTGNRKLSNRWEIIHRIIKIISQSARRLPRHTATLIMKCSNDHRLQVKSKKKCYKIIHNKRKWNLLHRFSMNVTPLRTSDWL